MKAIYRCYVIFNGMSIEARVQHVHLAREKQSLIQRHYSFLNDTIHFEITMLIKLKLF